MSTSLLHHCLRLTTSNQQIGFVFIPLHRPKRIDCGFLLFPAEWEEWNKATQIIRLSSILSPFIHSPWQLNFPPLNIAREIKAGKCESSTKNTTGLKIENMHSIIPFRIGQTCLEVQPTGKARFAAQHPQHSTAQHSWQWRFCFPAEELKCSWYCSESCFLVI